MCTIEYWRTSRVVFCNHFQNNLRVSNEHRRREGDVGKFLVDFLLHSGGQDCSCNLRLGCRKGGFPQYFRRTGEKVELTIGAGVHACPVALQAAVEEDLELGSVVEDDLAWK